LDKLTFGSQFAAGDVWWKRIWNGGFRKRLLVAAV